MKPSDFSVEQDRALLSFILDNSSKFDRWEIFLQAQKEEVLQNKTILQLYLRYHRYLFPLFTGKPSDESVELESFPCAAKTEETEEKEPAFSTDLSSSDVNSHSESESSDDGSTCSSLNCSEIGIAMDLTFSNTCVKQESS